GLGVQRQGIEQVLCADEVGAPLTHRDHAAFPDAPDWAAAHCSTAARYSVTASSSLRAKLRCSCGCSLPPMIRALGWSLTLRNGERSGSRDSARSTSIRTSALPW